ncbi:hypothetical protein BAPKO_0844 [Borreliella afzelii PKo]|nr:hypothetical protein BAPKO_0844 [Borreliella afzelii PKo]
MTLLKKNYCELTKPKHFLKKVQTIIKKFLCLLWKKKFYLYNPYLKKT